MSLLLGRFWDSCFCCDMDYFVGDMDYFVGDMDYWVGALYDIKSDCFDAFYGIILCHGHFFTLP